MNFIKTCTKCKEVKSLGEFYLSKRYKDGRQHRCKVCAKTYTQVATKLWRLQNPEKVRESGIKTKTKLKYGLNRDEVNDLLVKQNYCCAICSRKLDFQAPDKRDKPHIDHNHTSGIVRGLLCLTCNTGLGMFGDSTNLLELAKNYLFRQSDRLSELASLKG